MVWGLGQPPIGGSFLELGMSDGSFGSDEKGALVC